MKILNQGHTFNNIAFQKRLAARANVLSKDGNAKQVSIYELDEGNDVKYLENALFDEKWKNNYYLEGATVFFDDDYKNVKYYTMEDDANNLLCYSILDEKNRSRNKLSCIETMPSQSSYREGKRGLKYIGETMLAFLAKETKRQGKDLYISSIAKRPKTVHFYFNQCRFNPCEKRNAKLGLSDLKAFINQNEKHTKGKIHLIV